MAAMGLGLSNPALRMFNALLLDLREKLQ